MCIISYRSEVIFIIKTTKPCRTWINNYTSTLKGLLFCGFSLKQKQFTPLILAPPITGYNLNRNCQWNQFMLLQNRNWVQIFIHILENTAYWWYVYFDHWSECKPIMTHLSPLVYFNFIRKNLCQFSVLHINLLECQNLIKMQYLMHSVYITVTKYLS